MSVVQKTRDVLGIEAKCVEGREFNAWHYQQVRRTVAVCFAAMAIAIKGFNDVGWFVQLLVFISLSSFPFIGFVAAVIFEIDDCTCSNPVEHDYTVRNRGT